MGGRTRGCFVAHVALFGKTWDSAVDPGFAARRRVSLRYVVCSPKCVVTIYQLVGQALEESFRVRGSFSFSVPTHEPRIPSEVSHFSKRLSSLRPMMTRLGLPSPRSCGCPSPPDAKVWPASHLLQVAVGCVQQ